MHSPDQRIALITGANKGLGKEIARRLGELHDLVLIGSRSKQRGQATTDELRAAGIDAHLLTLDVTHEPSITRAAEFIEREYGRLDVLVNNAGSMHDRHLLPSETPIETMRGVFDTNFFGAVAVTQGLLPLLRRSNAGRIVNMSSLLGSLGVLANPASFAGNYRLLGYGASKTALNALTVMLAHELRDTPIKVNAASPGWVKTDLGGPDAPGNVEEGADTPIWLATLPPDGPTGGFFHERKPATW